MEPYFATGNDSVITNARKEYRRQYKAQWRRTKRSSAKEITTTWEKAEYRTLKGEAQSHKESVAGFLKKAAMAYMDKRFVVPDAEQVNKTIQWLALLYNSIAELQEAGLVAKEVERKLQIEIEQLEHDIRVLLFSPKTIEQVIKEQILNKPHNKANLIAFIQNLQP